MSLPHIALCLFGDVPQTMLAEWQKSWETSGNQNPVVTLEPYDQPFTGVSPYEKAFVDGKLMPGAEEEKRRGLADCVKAQAYRAINGPCIVLDVDTRVLGFLGMTRKPIAMVREPGARAWKPHGLEMNAGVIYQNRDIWPLYEQEWMEGIERGNVGGLCYGQYIFARVLEKLGGQELPERFNLQWERLKAIYQNHGLRVPIPKGTVVAHFNGPARKLAKHMIQGC